MLSVKEREDRKNPRVHKIRVRNSGAGNGSANFMDAWKNAFFLQEKPMSIKFLVLGGGGWFLGGGGSADFIFMGARIFVRRARIGNGRNTVSRVLFRKRELTEFCGKLGEFCEKLGEFASAHK